MSKFKAIQVLLLFTVLVMFMSKTTLAASSIEWTYLSNNVAVINNYMDPELQLTLVNVEGNTNVYIAHRKGSSSLDKHCSETPTTVISVDSYLVNFSVTYNREYDICMYLPTTEKGKTFLIDYLKDRDSNYKDVSIEGNTFSSHGFTEVYNNIRKSHLRKAL